MVNFLNQYYHIRNCYKIEDSSYRTNIMLMIFSYKWKFQF